MRLFGVDFTSAPRTRKPITVAAGRLVGRTVVLDTLEALPGWADFEAFLVRPGPWLGAFDFPFGLPREAVVEFRWPADWAALVAHCAALGRPAFRARLDAYRVSRPLGQRYAHRATDAPAGSHSPLKLVNPPVGLMFLEGAPRLLQAGVSLPGIHSADPSRNALEAYPGLLARSITSAPYKSDERARQTPARRDARWAILAGLESGANTLGLALQATASQRAQLIADHGGDLLDAVLAMLQAAWALAQGAPRYGMPAGVDPLEGWITTVPPPSH